MNFHDKRLLIMREFINLKVWTCEAFIAVAHLIEARGVDHELSVEEFCVLSNECFYLIAELETYGHPYESSKLMPYNPYENEILQEMFKERVVSNAIN